MDEQVVKAGQFTTEDMRGYFQAFAPIGQHDRLEWGGRIYQVETVKKERHKNRILWKETLARKVVE